MPWAAGLAASTDVSRLLRPRQSTAARSRPRRPSVTVDAVLATSSFEEVERVSQPSRPLLSTAARPTADTDASPVNSMLAIRARASGFIRTVASRLGQLPQYQALSALFIPAATPASPSAATSAAKPAATATARSTPPDMRPASHSVYPHPITSVDPVVGQPLLQRFLERADRLEVLYASLLSDLSNMAYEAEKVNDALLQRHQLVHVSSSAKPMFGPITREVYQLQLNTAEASGGTNKAAAAGRHAPAAPSTSTQPRKRKSQHQQQQQGQQQQQQQGQQQQQQQGQQQQQQGQGQQEEARQLQGWQAQEHLQLQVHYMDTHHHFPHQPSHGSSPAPALAPQAGSEVGPVTPAHPGVQSPSTLLHLASSSMDVMDIAEAMGPAESGCSGYQGCPDVEYSMLITSSMESLLDSIDEASASLPMEVRLESMASCDDFTPGASLDQVAVEAKLPRKLTSFRNTHGGAAPSRPAPPARALAAAAVSAASPASMASASASVDPESPDSPQAAYLIEQPAPPAAWFCADDPVTRVRYFIIQGSTNFDHWAINFNFEPVLFEDPSLGARIHRGVYEAALRLYDDLVPLVRQHLASHPSATICFGGHSLGGSLATALILLLVHRKVLRPSQLSPSYTFGAPAVFCAGSGGLTTSEPQASTAATSSTPGLVHKLSPAHAPSFATAAALHATPLSHSTPFPPSSSPSAFGPFATPLPSSSPAPPAHRCDTCQLHCDAHVHSAADRASRDAQEAAQLRSCGRRRPLLEQLGVTEDLIVSVMMHKDIVPRAFVCDYTVVADLLKQWMPSFKDHSTLSSNHQHKSLYNFLGRVAVLRPDDSAPFVVGDNAHPMLANVPGLYRLRDPRHIMHLSGSYDSLASASEPCARHDHRRSGAHSPAGSHHARSEPPSLRTAFLQFMNYPHPLQSLSTYESYGPLGAISRYHNPDNYTKALQGLVEERPAPYSDQVLAAALASAASDDPARPSGRKHAVAGARGDATSRLAGVPGRVGAAAMAAPFLATVGLLSVAAIGI